MTLRRGSAALYTQTARGSLIAKSSNSGLQGPGDHRHQGRNPRHRDQEEPQARTDAAPEIIAIKGGTLDTEIKMNLKPDAEIWTVGKLPFCQEHLAKPFEHMSN
jgi:hypothetical protein